MTVDVLTGQICTGVSKDYPENFTFQFGAVRLAVDCLWRLSIRGAITLTSRDHGHQFGLPQPVDAYAVATSVLRGSTVLVASLDEESGDLTLEFANGYLLQLLNDSSGYEPWNLTAPAVRIVALGGGGIATFPS